MHVSVWYKSFLKTRINENLKSLKRQTSLNAILLYNT